MTSIQELESRILRGESVTPEQFAAAQAADNAAQRIAELQSQRAEQIALESYVARREAEFEQTKQRFNDLRTGFFAALEARRRAIGTAISEYSEAAHQFNSELAESAKPLRLARLTAVSHR